MEMEKKLLEELVRRIVPLRVELTHKGNHIWESPKVATMLSNAGAFCTFFSHVSLRVEADPPQADTPSYHPLRVTITWYYRDGGQNGSSVDRFWHEPTNEILTHEETRARILETSKALTRGMVQGTQQ
jgi:hypothetical protein